MTRSRSSIVVGKRGLSVTAMTITVLLAALMAMVAGLLYVNWSSLFPSEQMKALREVEIRLQLPASNFRAENDRGAYIDEQGKKRFERHISLNYEDTSVLRQLRENMADDGWKERMQSPFDDYKYFSFVKGSGAQLQCVNGYTKPRDRNGITLHVSLVAGGEGECLDQPQEGSSI